MALFAILGCMRGLLQQKKLAFSLLICERMLPSLVAFSNETGFDVSCYLDGLRSAWFALQSGIIDYALLQRCRTDAPDTELYSHELTSYALNAALAICETMEFVVDGSTDHIRCIQTLASDSVDLYSASLEPSVSPIRSPSRDMIANSLSEDELRRQDEDRSFLAKLPERFDNKSVLSVRARANTQGSLLPC